MTVLAERPTQLDSGSVPAPRSASTPLRHVELARADGGEGPAGPASSYVGYIIDGRYRVEGVLGRGGMGVVYRARHEVIDKVVAVKILLPTEDPDVVERFVNEARAATAIGNAHIVDTIDFGALPDGSTYFVMEHLEGETLARRLKRDKFLPVAHALAVTRQIGEGIGAAHRAGIVHRDLKPENIFLVKRDGEDDFVKLLDFGIAKIQSAQNRITRAGTIFGTPHYMSPEQAAGTDVDPRTDLYSLGIMLYEMLSGRVPFDAENPMGLLTQHLYTEPTPSARSTNSSALTRSSPPTSARSAPRRSSAWRCGGFASRTPPGPRRRPASSSASCCATSASAPTRKCWRSRRRSLQNVRRQTPPSATRGPAGCGRRCSVKPAPRPRPSPTCSISPARSASAPTRCTPPARCWQLG
jgi:serine/threonine protein kinase